MRISKITTMKLDPEKLDEIEKYLGAYAYSIKGLRDGEFGKSLKINGSEALNFVGFSFKGFDPADFKDRIGFFCQYPDADSDVKCSGELHETFEKEATKRITEQGEIFIDTIAEFKKANILNRYFFPSETWKEAHERVMERRSSETVSPSAPVDEKLAPGVP